MINYVSTDLTLGELEEGDNYSIEQEEGYSDGVHLAIFGTKVLIGHFWNKEAEYRETEVSTDEEKQFAIMDLQILNVLKLEQLLTGNVFECGTLEPSNYKNFKNITLEELYHDIYFNIYEAWGSGALNEYKEYFDVVETRESFEEFTEGFKLTVV